MHYDPTTQDRQIAFSVAMKNKTMNKPDMARVIALC